MNMKNCFFIALLCLVSQSEAAAPGQRNGDDVMQCSNRRRDIYFRTTVLIKMGLNNKRVQDLIASVKEERAVLWDHPLCESEKVPYKDGNGGLLDPILTNFERVKEQIAGDGYAGVRIALNGCVSADGIAQYKFDDTHIGSHYQKYLTHDGQTYKKDHYKMSKLEEAILGFLQERVIDRQKYDLCKEPFLRMATLKYANRFAQCIKHEWTSIQNTQDSGIRTDMEEELIERYMARSTYWPSKLETPQQMRSGEIFRKKWLDPENDPLAAIELTEFEVNVQMPETSTDEACQLM